MIQPIPDEHVRDLVDAFKLIIMDNLWALLGTVAIIVASYIFKDDLKDRYAGYKWRRNVEYRRLDQVYFYEWHEIGVIEYIAKVETAFTMYTVTVKDDKISVTGGRSIVIPNAELQDMHIARFKPHIGDPREVPSFIIEDIQRKVA
jgi:hypothetical protein